MASAADVEVYGQLNNHNPFLCKEFLQNLLLYNSLSVLRCDGFSMRLQLHCVLALQIIYFAGNERERVTLPEIYH